MEAPKKAYNACLEWEDRAQQGIDEAEVTIEAMKIFLAAMEEDDGALELPRSL